MMVAVGVCLCVRVGVTLGSVCCFYCQPVVGTCFLHFQALQSWCLVCASGGSISFVAIVFRRRMYDFVCLRKVVATCIRSESKWAVLKS